MGQIPEDPVRADVTGDLYQECVQELQRSSREYGQERNRSWSCVGDL
jgi:hypothetical protein